MAEAPSVQNLNYLTTTRFAFLKKILEKLESTLEKLESTLEKHRLPLLLLPKIGRKKFLINSFIWNISATSDK